MTWRCHAASHFLTQWSPNHRALVCTIFLSHQFLALTEFYVRGKCGTVLHKPLQWRHRGAIHSTHPHRSLYCLFKSLFALTVKKHKNPGPLRGNSSVTGRFSHKRPGNQDSGNLFENRGCTVKTLLLWGRQWIWLSFMSFWNYLAPYRHYRYVKKTPVFFWSWFEYFLHGANNDKNKCLVWHIIGHQWRHTAIWNGGIYFVLFENPNIRLDSSLLICSHNIITPC